jgi:hypothetical protein
MGFCVYQGITTLINLTYNNRGHAQVAATNLKQRRMYNLTMPCGRVLLDILRHFSNYEKIITTRMHARVMMMWITRQVMKWQEKWGTGQTEQLLILVHPDYSSKLKSFQELNIRFEAMVTKEVVDDVGLWVDGGTQHRLSVSLSLHRVLDPSDPLHQ